MRKARLDVLKKLSRTITTLVDWKVWNKALQDMRFREYIMTGLKDGFRIGFQGAVKCCAATTNMRSATEKAEAVSRYVPTAGVCLGESAGPIK